MLEWITGQTKQLQTEGVSLSEICIVARTNRLCSDYEQILHSEGLATHTLSRQKVDDRACALPLCIGLKAWRSVLLRVAIQAPQDVVEQRLTNLNERAGCYTSCVLSLYF